jgi:hypothetical protein
LSDEEVEAAWLRVELRNGTLIRPFGANCVRCLEIISLVGRFAVRLKFANVPGPLADHRDKLPMNASVNHVFGDVSKVCYFFSAQLVGFCSIRWLADAQPRIR